MLINVCGGPDMGLFEFQEVSELISRLADPEADVIIGTTVDESLQDELVVTVIATDFNGGPAAAKPVEKQEPEVEDKPEETEKPNEAEKKEETSARMTEADHAPIDIPPFLQRKKRR